MRGNRLFFFFNDTATTEIYTLSLHDALPISLVVWACWGPTPGTRGTHDLYWIAVDPERQGQGVGTRSEEHTSELQSQSNLVCRLLLEKKKGMHVHRPYHVDRSLVVRGDPRLH